MEPVNALAAVQRAVGKSKRSSSVSLPVAFVRQQTGAKPPASKLVGARRGADIRMRLYLTLVMQATRHPFQVKARTTRGYGELLGLPADTAARRVSDALHGLEQTRLIVKAPLISGEAGIELLTPDGSGTEWPATKGSRYISLPIGLWSNGWILRLAARDLAVYMALRELTGGKTDPEGVPMDGVRKRQYGLSDDTWTRALVTLRDLGFVETKTEIWGDEFQERRRRQRYMLTSMPVSGRPVDWPNPF